jgi:hypothetical protein
MKVVSLDAWGSPLYLGGIDGKAGSYVKCYTGLLQMMDWMGRNGYLRCLVMVCEEMPRH